MVELLGRRLAEAMVMDAHRVALAEHVTHDAALAGGIHALQHDEQPPCRAFDAIRVHEPLVSGDFGGAVEMNFSASSLLPSNPGVESPSTSVTCMPWWNIRR